MEEASSLAAVGIAERMIQARTGCSPEAAVTALSTAAHGHAMTVYEMAEVMIANRDLRFGESDRA